MGKHIELTMTPQQVRNSDVTETTFYPDDRLTVSAEIVFNSDEVKANKISVLSGIIEFGAVDYEHGGIKVKVIVPHNNVKLGLKQ